MTPTEQKAFDQMREALEHIQRCIGFDKATIHQGSATWCEIDDALTAANAVSHAKPETAPATEGGAITSESAANAVSESAIQPHEGCDNLGIPLSCGKPLCSPKQHHPLCKEYVQPQALGEAVYLVATGETHNGEETYCRYDYPPALSEFERLYTHPQATEPAGYKLVPVELTPEMLRAIQLKSAIGAEIAANWTGAYECFQELYSVAIAAAPEAKQ